MSRIPRTARRQPSGSLRLALATALVATLTLTSCAAASPCQETGPPVAASPLAVGVQFKGMWSDYDDGQRAAVLDRLASAGVDSVRIDVSWAMLQPDGPDRYSPWGVEFVDRVIAMAADKGLDPLVTLWMSPTWASGTLNERALPRDPADFQRVAEWAADRWDGKVAGWEVWNEPNDSAFMAGADPVAYTELLKAAYAGFKAGSPDTPVVFGGTSYVDTAWVAEAYAAGAAGYFDVMATHPYMGQADAPPELPEDGQRERLTHVTTLRELMVSQGDAGKPIWFTEFGWSSHDNNGPGRPVWAYGVSEAEQADYLVRTLRLVQTQYPWVTRAYWYTERNQATGDPHQDNFGLLTRDLEPKPAYNVLASYLSVPAASTTPRGC